MTNSVTITLPSSPHRSLYIHHGSASTTASDSDDSNYGKTNGSVNSSHNTLPKFQASLLPSTEKLKDNNVFFGLVILIWYFVSVGHNLLNKRLLEKDIFPFPFTLTLLQLFSITTYSFIYITFFSKNDKHVVTSVREVLDSRRNRNLVIFLSSIKFLTLVFSHLSLSQVPLAFTHTVKGSLPLFVVFLSTVFLRQTHSRNVYLSLIPIVVGVALVSYNPSHHSSTLSWGIIFAFVSTLNLALLNVFSKKLLSTTFSAISLLHLLTKMSLLIFFPFYILVLLTHRSELISWSYMTLNLPFLLILDGIMSFSQNILAFSLLSMCSPLTYSIANCSKRVAIICLSFFVFSVQNLTPQSMLGIGISLLGIFGYNMAKHAEKMQMETLPTHRDNRQSTYQTKANHYMNNGSHHGLSNGFLLPQNGNPSTNNGEIHVDFDRHSIGSFYNV